MKKFLFLLLTVMMLPVIFFSQKTNVKADDLPSVIYSGHVQNIGWQSDVSNGAIAGTTGQSLRVEAMKIRIAGDNDLGIRYRAHVQNIGWQNWVSNGETAGTSGKSLRVEALRMELTGKDASKYDVYYSAHVENYGWLNWARNGQTAGSAGKSLRVEAVMVKLVQKGQAAPANPGSFQIAAVMDNIDPTSVSLAYNGHYSNIGWSSETGDGAVSGTDGVTRLEAFNVLINNAGNSGIRYRSYVQNVGWQDWKYNGDAAGTTGQGLRLESMKMELYGEAADKYDLYYSSYVENAGWLNWAKNGEASGSEGQSLKITSFRALLVQKGSPAPGNTGTISATELGNGPEIRYSVHESNIGWRDAKADGNAAGNAGNDNQIEALKITSPDPSVTLQYSTLVAGSGWQGAVSNGVTSGTTGKSKGIEAVKISLNGNAASLYDIYYRTYLKNYGWLNWTTDGQISGSDELGFPIDGIEIVLKIKGTPVKPASDGLSISSITGEMAHISYETHVQNIGWTGYEKDGIISGTTGKGLRVEAFRAVKTGTSLSGSVQYRAHVENVGWQDWTGDGAIAGTTGRSLRVEAISMRLTGQMADTYDIYYRCHIQDKGWTGWAKNGANCGSRGLSLRVEAIQARLIYKCKDAPGDIINTFYTPMRTGEGIDVSSYQGKIDWSKAASYAKFAIIRANSHKNGTSGTDKYFFDNMRGAKLNNVQVGVYCYSTATTKEQAIEEAERTIALVRQAGGTDFPIFIDQEDESQKGLSNETRTEMIQAFVDKVNESGYMAGVYSYYYWLTKRVDLSSIHDAYIWVADYGTSSVRIPEAKMWQYSSKGSVPGINGAVDLDRSF
jgi:uncharacterized protein YjdB